MTFFSRMHAEMYTSFRVLGKDGLTDGVGWMDELTDGWMGWRGGGGRGRGGVSSLRFCFRRMRGESWWWWWWWWGGGEDWWVGGGREGGGGEEGPSIFFFRPRFFFFPSPALFPYHSPHSSPFILIFIEFSYIFGISHRIRAQKTPREKTHTRTTRRISDCYSGTSSPRLGEGGGGEEAEEEEEEEEEAGGGWGEGGGATWGR